MVSITKSSWSFRSGLELMKGSTIDKQLELSVVVANTVFTHCMKFAGVVASANSENATHCRKCSNCAPVIEWCGSWWASIRKRGQHVFVSNCCTVGIWISLANIPCVCEFFASVFCRVRAISPSSVPMSWIASSASCSASDTPFCSSFSSSGSLTNSAFWKDWLTTCRKVSAQCGDVTSKESIMKWS